MENAQKQLVPIILNAFNFCVEQHASQDQISIADCYHVFKVKLTETQHKIGTRFESGKA